jgi:hypothetical protein
LLKKKRTFFSPYNLGRVVVDKIKKNISLGKLLNGEIREMSLSRFSNFPDNELTNYKYK